MARRQGGHQWAMREKSWSEQAAEMGRRLMMQACAECDFDLRMQRENDGWLRRQRKKVEATVILCHCSCVCQECGNCCGAYHHVCN